jgi:2-oxoglutarate ferredoxin oxidoreductase subunit delta
MEDIITNVRSNKGPMLLVIAPERCKGCGFCVAFCPKNVLAMSTGHFNAKGYSFAEPARADACSACALCEMYCPDFAIHVSKPAEELVQASATQSN